MRWEPRYTQKATQGLRSFHVESGIAGTINRVIKALCEEENPRNDNPIEETENMYRHIIGDHVVEYEVVEEGKILKILLIQ